MKRIVCIINSMDKGGAETILMKIFRQSYTNTKFDFIMLCKKKTAYEDEIKYLGGICYHLDNVTLLRSPIKYICSIYEIVKNNNYKSVLLSVNNVHMSLGLLGARLAGAKYYAIRSTNSSTGRGIFFDKFTRKINFISRFCSNVRLAPSHLAADFIFGKDSVKKHNVHILHNGLDLNLFSFNDNLRNKKRIKLKLDNKFVVGHIGRLSEQKNHSFLLKVFKEIANKRNDAILLLIGTGNLEQDIRNKAQNLGIADKVVFAGVRSDVDECLMAMDVMVFPSFYEGMPNVVIEAQTTGLPCIISDTITEECQITDIVMFMSLNDAPEMWADNAIKAVDIPINRSEYVEKMRQAGYDIRDVADKFVKYMFG